MRRRGITDFEKVQIDPWPTGNFGNPLEEGRRISRCLSYYREEPTDNGYARPVEGVLATVDAARGEVLEVLEDVYKRQHVGQPVLDRLELPDGPAELHPDLGVLGGRLEAPPGPAHLLGRHQGRGHLAKAPGAEGRELVPGRDHVGIHLHYCLLYTSRCV